MRKAASRRVPPNPFPECVRRIGIPAPASAPERAEVEESLKLFKAWGIDAALGRAVFSGTDESYLSASVEARLRDFNGFAADKSIDLILCARGGYGSAQMLPGIDWAAIKRRRLPVLGYSDITALHLGMLARRAGVAVACQMAAKLSKSLRGSLTEDGMRRALRVVFGRASSNLAPLAFPGGGGLEALRRGRAAGPLLPVNLSLLVSLLGTEFMPDLKGSILIVEDIGEKPRTLDRHLTQLRLAGALGDCAGLVFGDFKNCGSKEEKRILMEGFAKYVDGPVLCGLPFGHSLPSLSFVYGEPAELDGGRLLATI